MEESVVIHTTRAKAEALAAAMAHEHVSYTDEGQLVKGFLDDVDRALAVAEVRHTKIGEAIGLSENIVCARLDR